MTAMTAAASPLSEATRPATADRQQAADPREVLIHDIRTPLAAISGYAQLLQRRTGAGKSDVAGLADGLRGIEQAARRVRHLLDELTGSLPFPGAEGPNHQPKPIDLVGLAQGIAAESQAAALGRAQVVVLSPAPQLVGWWDSARLQSLLANLIDNALKYNRYERPVVVNIQPEDDVAVISVADGGVGIPAGELAHVLDPGYRASNVISQVSGSGLGLAGVHQIVVAHGGTLALDSQLGSGTTVTVRLPLGVPTP
jgi:signal transduction histidine kinase